MVFGLMVVLLAITAAMDIGPLIDVSDSANAIITITAGFIFMLVHGSRWLGWRSLSAFVLITALVSFASEAIGVATGWVFGAYHYTDLLGPKILGVPPFIQVGYIAMGYASMVIARIILGPQSIKGWVIPMVALAGACVMVSWDVVMDPYQATVAGDWIWHNGGAYFGIPFHNYVGWFFTVLVFLLLYNLYAARYGEKPGSNQISRQPLLMSLPVIYYALVAMGIVLTPLVSEITSYSTPQNYSGAVESLEYSMSLIAVFVMGVPVLLAICRLFIDASPPEESRRVQV